MMTITEIHKADTPTLSKIYNAYCRAFPEDERRSEMQFQELRTTPEVLIWGIFEDNKMMGYLITWRLSEAMFVEHFEIFPEFQGQNFGSLCLKNLSLKYPKLVLEAEPKHLDEMAARRIRFYQKNDFSIISEDYIQPPYSSDKQELNLWLLANFTPENIPELEREIHCLVYKI